MDHEELRKAFIKLKGGDCSKIAMEFALSFGIDSIKSFDPGVARELNLMHFTSACTFFDAYTLGFAAGFELGSK